MLIFVGHNAKTGSDGDNRFSHGNVVSGWLTMMMVSMMKIMMKMMQLTKMMIMMTWGDDDDDDEDKNDDNDDVPEIFSLPDHSFTVVPCQRHFWLVWIVIWMMMIKMVAMVMIIIIMTGRYKEQLTMNWNSPLVFYSRIWDEFISCLRKKGRYGDFVSLIFQPSSPSPSSLLSWLPSRLPPVTFPPGGNLSWRWRVGIWHGQIPTIHIDNDEYHGEWEGSD